MSNYLQALRRADDLVAGHGFNLASVPHPVAVVYLVGQLEYELVNGGVVQWLSNRTGRYATRTAAALHEIGADACSGIVTRMIQPLGSAIDLEDDVQRAAAVARVAASQQAVWRALADDLLEWPDDVDTLLRAYVSSNESHFK